MEKLIFNKGINDSHEQISWNNNGKVVYCPIYAKWREMIRRCYSESFHKKRSTYIGCTVCEEWLTFSNFKKWMETQDWENKSLDKDLLSNTKVYSPETCVFISPQINNFLTLSNNRRGDYPIGVGLSNNGEKYRAVIEAKYIGTYETVLEAHQSWQRAKLEKASNYQITETDVRVKDGLQRIINLLTDDLNNNRITTNF